MTICIAARKCMTSIVLGEYRRDVLTEKSSTILHSDFSAVKAKLIYSIGMLTE